MAEVGELLEEVEEVTLLGEEELLEVGEEELLEVGEEGEAVWIETLEAEAGVSTSLSDLYQWLTRWRRRY